MRVIFFLLVVCNLSAQVVVDLDNLTERYVDLERYQGDTVIFKGHYKGDRLVFRNAVDVSVQFLGKISTTHAEDAIAFLGDVSGLDIYGNLRLNGAVTFWGKLYNVDITGLHFHKAHTGIRFTQPFAHSFVRIYGNTFNKIAHEGIYAGPHYAFEDRLSQIHVFNNRFTNIGWDAIQFGACLDCRAERNKIIRAAYLNVKNQNWPITVNPGSRVYLRDNVFLNCPGRVQCLDSRCFEW